MKKNQILSIIMFLSFPVISIAGVSLVISGSSLLYSALSLDCEIGDAAASYCGSSQAVNDSSNKDQRKEALKALARKETVKAKEIFGTQALVNYKLKPEDEVDLKDTSVGVVIGKGKKVLTVILYDDKFDNLNISKKNSI